MNTLDRATAPDAIDLCADAGHHGPRRADATGATGFARTSDTQLKTRRVPTALPVAQTM